MSFVVCLSAPDLSESLSFVGVYICRMMTSDIGISNLSERSSVVVFCPRRGNGVFTVVLGETFEVETKLIVSSLFAIGTISVHIAVPLKD